jgi:hypothetical protein
MVDNARAAHPKLADPTSKYDWEKTWSAHKWRRPKNHKLQSFIGIILALGWEQQQIGSC